MLNARKTTVWKNRETQEYMELAWAEEEAKWVYEQDLLEEIAEANEKPLGPSGFVFEPVKTWNP
jgi:hypothetical protein